MLLRAIDTSTAPTPTVMPKMTHLTRSRSWPRALKYVPNSTANAKTPVKNPQSGPQSVIFSVGIAKTDDAIVGYTQSTEVAAKSSGTDRKIHPRQPGDSSFGSLSAKTISPAMDNAPLRVAT